MNEQKKTNPSNLKKFLLYLPLSFLLIIFFLELFSRIFLACQYQAPFLKPQGIILHYYPELHKAQNTYTNKNDGIFDILILGGSVLHNDWGEVEKHLTQQLRKKIGLAFRVFNLSNTAHSTLDSKFKMQLLTGKHFDLVMLYHGINDVRANNAPDSVFQTDYSHYLWYAHLRNILKHKEMSFSVIPYMLDYLLITARSFFQSDRFMPLKVPKAEWIPYGHKIKTQTAFEKNIKDIVATAQKNKTPVLLLTFAYYIPENYSMKKFLNEELDYHYGKSVKCSVELWGKPADVRKGIEAHNSIIKKIAQNGSHIYFIDMNSIFNKNKTYFDDVCHLTDQGSSKFVSALIPEIRQIIKKQPGAHLFAAF